MLLYVILSERCNIVNDKQDLLRWGLTENEGCHVLVWLDDLKKNVDAFVHYKGALPPYDGIMFGVEIVVSAVMSPFFFHQDQITISKLHLM